MPVTGEQRGGSRQPASCSGAVGDGAGRDVDVERIDWAGPGSAVPAGVARADTFYQAGVGKLAASFGYTINQWLSLSFDAMNLNNPKLKYYTKTAAIGKQPYYFYDNGRQYYVNLRFKF